MQQVRAGDRLPEKTMLAQVPMYIKLKTRSEENNHAGDACSPVDKFLKSIQQRALNMALLQDTQYGMLQQDPEHAVSAQQFFHHLMETEDTLLKERKRRILPGSVVSTQNMLFDSKDRRTDRPHSNINMAGMFGKRREHPRLYFQNPARRTSFRLKGGKLFSPRMLRA